MESPRGQSAEDAQVSFLLEGDHGTHRWELEPSVLGMDAIDSEEVEAFRSDVAGAGRGTFTNGQSTVDVLRAMRLVDEADHPNRAALALFCKPEKLRGMYPSLGCRLAAVPGDTVLDVTIDDALVEGNVFTLLQAAMDFCRRHLFNSARITGELQAQVGMEIPAEVLREALANAFAHRDYSMPGLVRVIVYTDRVEVNSPGRLHFGLHVQDLYKPHSSRPWNPRILDCLYRRGVVEQLGSGTLRMIQHCNDVGLGRPVFYEESTSFVCAIPRPGYWLDATGRGILLSTRWQSRDPRFDEGSSDPGDVHAYTMHPVGGNEEHRRQVLFRLNEGPAKRRELAELVNFSRVGICALLDELQDLGLVKVNGQGHDEQWELVW